MRRAAKVDGNQAEIVDALRYEDCLVHVTSRLGGGFPNLVVYERTAKVIFLVECKMPGELLTPAECHFANHWPVHIVYSADDARKIVETIRKVKHGV